MSGSGSGSVKSGGSKSSSSSKSSGNSRSSASGHGGHGSHGASNTPDIPPISFGGDGCHDEKKRLLDDAALGAGAYAIYEVSREPTGGGSVSGHAANPNTMYGNTPDKKRPVQPENNNGETPLIRRNKR